MTPIDQAATVVVGARDLVAAIKQGTDTITIGDARTLLSQVTAAEGWLQSARTLLTPPGVL